MLRFVLALAALLVATAVSAQAYRWVDKDGKVHYSDSPPPAAAKNVEQKKLQGSVVESGEVPYETQQAARNFPVTVYTTKDCKDLCKTVTDALNRRGVPYREVSVGDESSIKELKAKTGGDTVPVTIVGKDVLRGTDVQSLYGALDVAGYPQNAPARPAPRPVQAAAPAAPKPAPAEPEAPRGPYAPK